MLIFCINKRNSAPELHLVFLQIEHIACPFMYIVGEDDQSSSSIENANLVYYVLFYCNNNNILNDWRWKALMFSLIDRGGFVFMWYMLFEHIHLNCKCFSCEIYLNTLVFGLTFMFLVVWLSYVLFVTRSKRPWGLQVNPSCSPFCRTPVPVTWLNRLTHQMQDCPCGAWNQKNVSLTPELHFSFSQILFNTWCRYPFNFRLVLVK